jgi:three-Cys-motif partner protein
LGSGDGFGNKKWKRKRIAFIDLFDGPGSYEGKVPSTPMRVLGAASKNSTLKEMLVAIFSDADPRHVHSLEEAIASFSGLNEVSNALPVLANRRRRFSECLKHGADLDLALWPPVE